MLEIEKDFHKIKCDCCGSETLAQIKDGKLVIIDRRHGRKHVAVLAIDELIHMIGTTKRLFVKE